MASPVMAGGMERTPVSVVVAEAEDDGAFAAAGSIPGLGGGAGAAPVIGGLALAAIVAAAANDVDSSSDTK